MITDSTLAAAAAEPLAFMPDMEDVALVNEGLAEDFMQDDALVNEELAEELADANGDGWGVGVAEALVADLDVVDGNRGHLEIMSGGARTGRPAHTVDCVARRRSGIELSASATLVV